MTETAQTTTLDLVTLKDTLIAQHLTETNIITQCWQLQQPLLLSFPCFDMSSTLLQLLSLWLDAG